MTAPDEVKVFLALDGPNHTRRTMSGVALQTGLNEQLVAEVLKKYNLTLTRLSEAPAVSGPALVGLFEKVGGGANLVTFLRGFRGRVLFRLSGWTVSVKSIAEFTENFNAS